MAKGTSDLSIVPASSVHVDAYCDVWLVEHAARQFLDPRWDWEPFDWHIIVLSQLRTAAAVDPQGNLEGLIAIDEANSATQGLLVVEYVQSSPFNHGKSGFRRGVGTMLMHWAALSSQKLGYHGALTLVSTSKAEPFYDALGFGRTRKTSKGRQVYELPPSGVANFLAATTMMGRAGKP